MAVGKNKRTPKGKKKLARKVANPYTKKEWYMLTAPGHFSKHEFGQTPVTRSSGKRRAEDDLVGRIIDMNVSDLGFDEAMSYRKISLRIEGVQEQECLTNFFGMDMTRDRLAQLFRKGITLIESYTDIRTLDGYVLRLFSIAFTKRGERQISRTAYGKSSQIEQIRKLMTTLLKTMSSDCSLKELVSRFLNGEIEAAITKECSRIFPVQNVFIRKVKVVSSPKYDMTALLAMHEPVTVTIPVAEVPQTEEPVGAAPEDAADTEVQLPIVEDQGNVEDW